jgi:histidinol-phosphate phosphatase family protein
MNKHPTLFLDRDGTINVDLMSEYLSTPEKTKLIPGAGRAVIRAKNAGFKIALITNQAGVAKKLIPPDALPIVHAHIEKLIAEEAGLNAGDFRFDDIRVCPHHPDEKCGCRKPQIQMLKESIDALQSNIDQSVFIGDRETDLLCAHASGMPSILVLTGHGEKTQSLIKNQFPHVQPLAIVPSLTEAVDLAIQRLERLRPKRH